MSKKLKQVITKLIKKKIKISVAESCTGGMLAQTITSVSGASHIFSFGVITYSNHAKIKYLKVPYKIIKKYGSVSKECCYAMVTKLAKISGAKLNLAITGIAGPNGGSNKKPVGLVYIGIKRNVRIEIKKFLFTKKIEKALEKILLKNL